MPITVSVAQYPTQVTQAKTFSLLRVLSFRAASSGVNLLLFPEAFLGGYPRTSTFGAAVGARTEAGRDEYYAYWQKAVDLGDVSPDGSGDYKSPGDGTREKLEAVAKETGVFLAVGIVEKSGGTLWCGVVFVDPERGVVGKRRKLMPTGTERLVWGIGQANTLKAITTSISGQKVTIGSAICWENYMPLLRTSLYSQGVTIYLAPTADARETWLPTMRHIAMEGRCYVLGCNQFVTRRTLPVFVPSSTAVAEEEEEPPSAVGENWEAHFDFGSDEEVACNGGSVIVDPLGEIMAGPLWGAAGTLQVTIDDVEKSTVRAKMDFDSGLGGHYSRSDVFKLKVEGLDLPQ